MAETVQEQKGKTPQTTGVTRDIIEVNYEVRDSSYIYGQKPTMGKDLGERKVVVDSAKTKLK